MKNLLLLLLAVYFYSNPVAAAAADGLTLQLDVKFGECPGSEPGKTKSALRPYLWIFMITDKKTDRIESVIIAPYSEHSERTVWPLESESLKLFIPRDSTKELQVAVFVQTVGNDKMTGIDNQIFYGYQPEKAWPQDPLIQYNPAEKLGTEPFRYGEFVFTVKHANGKEQKVFEAKEKGCNHDNYVAWIANHGIYRLEKTDKGELFFSNLYYWPRLGMIFT